jgi:hypothetical protein
MRQALQSWHNADSNLERDAAKGGADIATRADKLSAEAARYNAAKKALFAARAADTAKSADSLEPFESPEYSDDAAKKITSYIGIEMSAVNAGIDAFGNDPDKGIQQLRQMMERERIALNNLSAGLKDLQSASANVARASEQADQQRMKVLDHMQALSASVEHAGEAPDAPSWSDYYRSLSGNGRVAPVTNVRPPAGPGVATSSATAPASVSAPVAPRPSPASVPLSRYTGGWTYLRPNSVFLGLEPEFVDLVVHEENGGLSGTLYGRFKTPSGTDPVLRFDFSGAIQNARNQSLSLTTGDGTQGIIELIPGPAFNLLEVNFNAGTGAGKVRQGNFILVKK